MMVINILLVIIGIVLNLSEVQSLSIPCNQNKKSFECFHPTSHCNRKQGFCECNKKYPVEIPELNVCLTKQKFGDRCVHSIQCQHLYAICVDTDSVELNRFELIGIQLLTEYYRKLSFLNFGGTNRSIKVDGYKSLGNCQCRPGFRPVATLKGIICQMTVLNDIECVGSHQCLQMDSNSHCNAKIGRCYCDTGYIYDTDRNECRISPKKFGDNCNHEIECLNWDTNMDCRYSQCICKSGYNFDMNTQRCKPTDRDEKKCAYGLKWDETSGECEVFHLYAGFRQNDYRFFSTDKLLETIVIVIFCCVTIAILRFWRNILPQHIYSNFQTGMISDFTYANRVQRRRNSRNSVSRSGRVIQLRVNLDSPDSQFLPEETFVDLPLTTSQSSLPPYEVANSSSESTEPQPPPYSDEPPTYEEALALSQVNHDIKTDNKV